MIVLDQDTIDELMNLPIAATLELTVDDRHFMLVDSEFFFDLCRKAGIVWNERNKKID